MLKKTLAGIMIVTLLTVPFLTSALNEQSPFEFIKLFVLTNVTTVLFAFLAVTILTGKKAEFYWNRGLSLVGIILLANIASFLFSNNPINSFWADINVPTDSLLTILVFLAFCFCCVQILADRDGDKLFTATLILIGSSLAAYAIIQHFGFDPVDWWGYNQMATNAYATIGQSVGFSMIVGSVVSLAVMSFFEAVGKPLRILLLLALFIMCLGILYSGSRTPALASLFVIFAANGIYFLKNRTRKALKDIGIVLLVTALAQTLYFFEGKNGLGEKLTSESIGKGVSERTHIWQDAINIWKKYPVLGAGPETFGNEQKIVNRAEHNQYQHWELLWTKAHNHYIHHLATTGLVGLAAELLLLFFLLFDFFKQIKSDSKIDYSHAGYVLGFVFLSVCYLTAFNFVLTQLFSYLLPTLYFLKRSRVIQIKFPRAIRFGLAGITVVLSGTLLFFTYNFWKGDVLFGTAKREFLLNKNPSAAIQAIDEAIAIQPYNSKLYCRKATIVAAMVTVGRSRYSQQEANAAVALIDNLSNLCVSLDPQSAENISIRAKIMAELYLNHLVDSPAPSIDGFRQAIQVNPNNPTYYYRLGALYLIANQPELYVMNMRLALQVKPDYLPAYTDLMGFFYRRGDKAQVTSLVQQVVKTKIDKPEFVQEIGNMINLSELNKDPESRQTLINIYVNLKQAGLIQ